MALPLFNSFETQLADETVLTLANSDDGTARNAFDELSMSGASAIHYDIARAAHGTLSGRFVQDGTNYCGVGWNNTSAGDSTDHYGRLYFYRTAVPTDAQWLVLGQDTSGNNTFLIQLASDGKVHGFTCTSTGVLGSDLAMSTDFPLNEWVRIEWHIVNHTSTGQLEIKMFSGDSTTVIETMNRTSVNTGSNVRYRYFGHGVNGVDAGADFWLDDIALNASAYIGPAFSGYAAEVLADSPVAYYRMDEASGQPQDSSGNANHTTAVNGTPVYALTGAIITDSSDDAILFEKASSEYFTAPDHTTLDPGNTFTLECWMKRGADLTGVQGLIEKGTNGYFLAIRDNDKVFLGQQDVEDVCESTSTITDTNWHHIVATKAGSANALYIDGVDVTSAIADPTIIATTSVLRIGSSINSQHFDGTLDEVAVYPTALSSQRVAAHYLAGISHYATEVMADAPVAYYRMDEASGLIQDSSGNANHAASSSGGPATYEQTGPITSDASNKALLMNGAEYSVPDHTTLDVGDVFTLEAWVNFADFSSFDDYIMEKQSGAFSFGVNMTGSDATFYLQHRGVADIVSSSAIGGASAAIWRHLVITKNGATVKQYWDGVDVTGSVTNSTIGNNASALIVGSSYPDYLAQVAIYPTALSEQRVLDHFVAGVGLFNTGWHIAGTGVNYSLGAETDWTNPGNVTADDAANTSVTLTADTNSDYMYASNFGISIPVEANILGVEYRFDRNYPTANTFTNVFPTQNAADGFTGDGLNGTVGTGLQILGAPDHLWGVAEGWTASQISEPGFGVAWNAHSAGAGATLTIDAVWARVTYEIEDQTDGWAIAGTGDDASVRARGGSYPPSADHWYDNEADNVVEKGFGAGEYTVFNTVLRFDTSSLPDDATVTSATLRFLGAVIEDNDNRSLVAEWYAFDGSVDGSDSSTTAVADAHTGTDITTLAPFGAFDLALTGLSNINNTGYTGLRLHLSGGSPSAANYIVICDYSHTTQAPPALIVEYTLEEVVEKQTFYVYRRRSWR